MASNYFSFFPIIEYDIYKNGETNTVLDLTRRFRIREAVMKRSINFYDYVLKEEERADILANRIYGDPKLDWLIFMINDVFDPYWEWPMGYYDFNEYVKGRYGSLENAMETIHHYEHIVQPEEMWQGVRIPERVVWVDVTAYHTIPESDRRQVDCYTQEQRMNEKRRNIKLLAASYLPQILTEASVVLMGK